MNESSKNVLWKMMAIDDEVTVHEFFSDFFSLRGFEVYIADNGKDGIELFKEKRPHVVLLDIKMKGIDGIEALKQIRAIDKDAIIIMITAVNDEASMKTAMELGANDYITKPLDLENLEKLVLQRLTSRELPGR